MKKKSMMYSVLEQFPTTQERERKGALDQAGQAERSAAIAELERIAVGADNRDTEPAKLSALLIGRALRALQQVHRLPSDADVGGFTHELAGLRAAHRMVVEAHQLRRADHLDLNSPRFGAAYTFILDSLKQVMESVGVDSQTAHRVFLELRDVVSMGQEKLQRDLNNM